MGSLTSYNILVAKREKICSCSIMFWEQRSEPSVFKDTELNPPVFETIHEIRYYREGKMLY
jgi:hypothetical protein